MVHVKGFNDMGRFKPLACDITRFITKSHVQVAMGHEWNFKHVWCAVWRHVFSILRKLMHFFFWSTKVNVVKQLDIFTLDQDILGWTRHGPLHRRRYKGLTCWRSPSWRDCTRFSYPKEVNKLLNFFLSISWYTFSTRFEYFTIFCVLFLCK